MPPVSDASFWRKGYGRTGEGKNPLAVLLLFCWALIAALPVNLAEAAASIVDDAGRTVSLKAPAGRIIALYAALSEIVVAMGLEDRIVGRTASDDAAPGKLPVVGTHMRPNPELVAGLRPDLVLQFEGRAEAGLAADSLEDLGVAVARFRIASFAELFSCIERLGVLTGEEERAAKLIQNMRERLDAARVKTASVRLRPTIFFEVRYPNLLGAGGGSMVSDIIDKAGGVNCLAPRKERMVRLSEERLAAENPEIYLVQEGSMNKNPIPVRERAHFRTLAALAKDCVFTVAETRFSRPGPQSLAAVEELADIILQCHRRVP